MMFYLLLYRHNAQFSTAENILQSDTKCDCDRCGRNDFNFLKYDAISEETLCYACVRRHGIVIFAPTELDALKQAVEIKEAGISQHNQRQYVVHKDAS